MFASVLNHQVPKYFSWTLAPQAVGTDAFSVNWNKVLLYMFPPFSLIQKCLRKIIEDKATILLITPVWHSRPWYPMLLNLLHDRPLLLPCNPQILKLPWSQTIHPLFQNRKFRLAVWPLSGDLLKTKNFQKGCAKYYRPHGNPVQKNSIRVFRNNSLAGVHKSYKCDPFSCSLNIILDYLVDLFYKGLEYRTINLHRSAIPMTHLPVDGICVGSHPFISRLMKGIFNLHPPCPRYVQTWDVSVVLHYLKYLSPAPLLSMKNLTLKLVMLMALVSLCRANLLHKLDLRFRVFKRDGVLFTLPPVGKSSRVTSPPIDIFPD